MGFSWGGFSQGLNKGLETAEKLGSMFDDAQIARLRSKGMKEAQEAAAKAKDTAASMVKDTGEQGAEQSAVSQPQAAPVETFKVDMGPGAIAAQGIGSGAQGRYVAGTKAFNDKGQAEAHAKKSAPSDLDFFIKNAVPQIAAKYIEQGQPEMAEKWTSYAATKESQKHMETWAKAKRATMAGDFEGAADHVMEMYKGYNDGVTPLSKEVVKDKDGNVTGFNVKLKNEETGEERVQFVDPQMLTQQGLAAMAPTEMFKFEMARQQQAETLRARAAADAANDARTMVRDVAKQDRVDDRADRREKFKAAADIKKEEVRGEQEIRQIKERAEAETRNLGASEKAKLEVRKAALREAGYAEDDINGMVPALLSVDGFKKGTSPEERRAMILSDLTKGDPSFTRLPPEKQKAKLDQMMSLLPGAAASERKPTAKPKAGPMIYDPATKSMIPRG